MSHKVWRRKRSGSVAVDELLDAAGRAFADLGVAKATMVDVCRIAGCSRATLYRYFPTRAALHLAYVHRATLGIAARLAERRRGIDMAPAVEMTDRILAGVEAVRSDPLLAVWFEPDNMAIPIALSQDSELLRAMNTAFVAEISADAATQAELEQRGEWLLRCIVSLLAMPARDAATERTLVECFVVPALVGDPVVRRSKA